MGRVIAAIATAAGSAGIGIVRLSGDGAIDVADRVFASASGRTLASLRGYTALYGHVSDEEGVVDDCVALVFRAPHSYTGEDVVELSCHGGRYLLTRVLRAALTAGAVPASAGEFTRRAFVNGKMDLTAADAVMDLIAAEGRLSAKTALSAHEGAIARAIGDARADLLAAAAQLAAVVDYPYEDIPDLSPAELTAALSSARDKLLRLLSTYDAGRVLREGIDTAIVGAPNVGKSTLMNLLMGEERSIVTDIAGTTRDIVEDTVRVGEVTLRLADTAGIRDSADTVERIGVERARARLERAALVLYVIDGSRPLTEEDTALLQGAADKLAIAVINKIDKGCVVNEAQLTPYVQRVVSMSAATGAGADALIRAVEELTGVASLRGDEALLSTERQRAGVQTAVCCIEEALTALDGALPDAAMVSVDAAVEALAVLTGEKATEAVVNEVFARFCVGK